MSRTETRVKNIHLLLSLIKEVSDRGTFVEKDKLIAECCFNWEVARRTVLEYLTILEMTGRISIDGKCVRIKQEDDNGTTTGS